MVTGLKQFLPAGMFERTRLDGSVEVSERKRSLVQIYTDPGGMRTVAVAEIWAKDPGFADNPW